MLGLETYFLSYTLNEIHYSFSPFTLEFILSKVKGSTIFTTLKIFYSEADHISLGRFFFSFSGILIEENVYVASGK